MKRFTFILAVSMICLVGASGAYARTYAGNLGVLYEEVKVGGTQQIQYYLNDAAASVTIEVKNSGGTTIKTLTGTTAQGLNTVAWDLTDTGGSPVGVGDYYFNVATTDVGYATWTNITPYQPGVVGVDVTSPTDTVVSARFWSPNGVQCNKVKTDPDFGRVYVANGSSGGLTSSATGAYHDKSGVYFLNCDLSDAHDGFLEAVTDTLFASASQYNPYKINVDPDREVIVVGGYSDGWEDLYFIDMDGDSYLTVFSRADFAMITGASWENVLHTAFQGTGAGTIMYGLYEEGNGYPCVGKWELGGWPLSATISAPVERLVSDSGVDNVSNSVGGTVYAMRNILFDAAGESFFVNNRRWGAGDIFAVAKFDITGPTLPQMIANANSWRGSLPGQYIYGNFNSVDYMVDPVDASEKLVVQRYYGGGFAVDQGGVPFYILDASSPTLDLLETCYGDVNNGSIGAANDYPQMCVFDAAGNVYYTATASEWLRMYAPPSAAYNFDIDYADTFAVVEVTGLDNEDWELYR